MRELRTVREPHNRVTVVLVPVSFTMPNFEQKKIFSSSWYSSSFYTHPRGYKMCLNVEANSWGGSKGSYVGVALYMMPGDYDNILKWPFRGEITIQLLNQRGDHEHHLKIIPVTDRSINEFCSRVLVGERSPNGWGIPQFISHTGLLPSYLQHDFLKFCIKEIKITN